MLRAESSSRARDLRRGFTLVELLVALTLFALLATLLFGALIAHVRLARLLAQRILEADAVRTATTVIAGELRRAGPNDLGAVAPDSLALRAFRGIGVVCGVSGTGSTVHFRGDRLPDPAKDSAVWIGAAGRSVVVAVTAVQPFTGSQCTSVAAGAVQLWHTAPPVTDRGVLLLFESGAYHLAGSALRYRIGAAGRQPLTADLFAHPATRFARPDAGTVELHLALASAPAQTAVAAVYYALARP